MYLTKAFVGESAISSYQVSEVAGENVLWLSLSHRLITKASITIHIQTCLLIVFSVLTVKRTLTPQNSHFERDVFSMIVMKMISIILA